MRQCIHTKLAVLGILAEELLDSQKNNDFLHLQNILPSSIHNDILMNITVKICDQINEEKRLTLC